MAEQATHQFASSKRRASSKGKATQSLGKENQLTAPTTPPTIDDRNAWQTYWKALSQPWRTEPEIDDGRQAYLAERRTITPDVENGIYPFKKVKLSRADIEWLLATHDNGRGPIDWSDTSQRTRKGLDLRGAILQELNLSGLPLTAMSGSLSWEEWVNTTSEQREAAVIYLVGADLHFTHLERTNLRGAHLEGAILYGAHMEGAYLYTAHLEGAILKETFFDRTTQLGRIVLGNEEFGSASLADIHWGDVNIVNVNWSSIDILGDERLSYWPYWQKKRHKVSKSKEDQLDEYRRAFRANRQLAVVLQAQGMSEEAERFAYRAQRLQRKVLWREGIHSLRPYLFSLFLDLLAGYGYKPGRSFLVYLLVISLFATIYYYLGYHITWIEAIVISMTAFHGRGFFPNQFHPGDPQSLVAAIEALVGMIMEVTLIATLTQRFFRKYEGALCSLLSSFYCYFNYAFFRCHGLILIALPAPA